MSRSVWQNLLSKWSPHFRGGYEIRIRITIGFLFLLIVVANLNSLRYFRQNQSLLVDEAKYRATENLTMMSGMVRSNPAENLRSGRFRDLARVAGFSEVQLVETDLLNFQEMVGSRFVDESTLRKLREIYSGEKETAGAIGSILPAAISKPYQSETGESVRSIYYHFSSDAREQLTLVAVLPVEAEMTLARFSTLNALFQLISIAAALSIAILLLKIALKPYQQIKSEAIAADVARTDQTESVDFAVETFQKVIAELKEKEQKLQRLYAQQRDRAANLEEYNEYILASMPSGVISCDTNGVITHFNEAAASFFRVNATSVVGKPYSDALSPFPVIVRMVYSALNQESETSLLETELDIPGGGRVWLSLDCSLLRDRDFTTRGAMVLISDLTGIKKLEAEIAMKEQMAVIGEMSAGLAHQLRNSMAAVVGFSQLLKKLTSGEGRAPDIVVSILKEAQTTEEMLNRFLKLSRPVGFSPCPTMMSEITAAVKSHFAEKARQQRIELAFDLGKKLPPLVCEHLLIVNALINLVQNSFEALPTCGKVTVAASYSKEDRSYRITVTDNGKGIPNDDLEKIFTPFYTSGKASGTGLGLSLARKWIVAHHGDIHCESNLGQGTTFTIILPQEPSTSLETPKTAKISLA